MQQLFSHQKPHRHEETKREEQIPKTVPLKRSKSLTAKEKEDIRLELEESKSLAQKIRDSFEHKERGASKFLLSEHHSISYSVRHQSESNMDAQLTKLDNMDAIKANGEVYYQFTPYTPLRICKLIGQIVGKALFEGIPLEHKFTHFLLKCMLSQEFDINDLMSYDPFLKSSLDYINTNVFDHNSMNIHFNVMDKQLGNIELVQNGSGLTVNNYNKSAYVKMFLEYYGFHKTKEQIEAFLDGLKQVVPAKLLNFLTIEDLEKLLIGTRDVDIEDWRRNTRYTGENAHSQHSTVIHFWSILGQMSEDQHRKFLQFCTGCRSVPIEGFKSLKNNRQEECLFTINIVKTNHEFIRAHTCFNRIDLPELSCKAKE